MSERLLKEFRERAEFLVPVPDVDELQRRGTARRRARLAAGATFLASVLAIGGTVVATTIDDDQAVEPAQIGPTAPPSTEACELDASGGGYRSVPSGCELPAQVDQWRYIEPGRYFVRPFNIDLRPARAGDLEVWFEHPSGVRSWYWWGGGVGMAGAGPEMAPYIRVAITPITGVPMRGEQCQGAGSGRVEAVPASVLSVADRLVASPGITVVAPPSSVQRFGYEAAHVQFTVTERCSGDEAFVLWRAFEPEGNIYAPLGEMPFTPEPTTPEGHVFEVWVVDMPGEQHVVVSADYSEKPPLISGDPAVLRARAADLAEMWKLLDSIRFEFTE